MSALLDLAAERDASRPPRGFYLTPNEQERIWSDVVVPDDPDGCWRWIGRIDPTSGEPVLFLRNKQRHPSHVIWADTGREPVPPRKRLVRTCGENKWCVNPAHRTRQGAAAREVYTADITLRGAPRRDGIPAELAVLPAPPELVASVLGEDVRISDDEPHPTSENGTPELARPRVGSAATELLDGPGIHVLLVDNSRGVSIYYAPDAECQGYGPDWRRALNNSREKYDAKAAERRAGAR